MKTPKIPKVRRTPEERRAFLESLTYWDKLGLVSDTISSAVPPVLGALFFGLTIGQYLALIWLEGLALWMGSLLRDLGVFSAAIDRQRRHKSRTPEEQRYIALARRWGMLSEEEIQQALDSLRKPRPPLKSAIRQVRGGGFRGSPRSNLSSRGDRCFLG